MLDKDSGFSNANTWYVQPYRVPVKKVKWTKPGRFSSMIEDLEKLLSELVESVLKVAKCDGLNKNGPLKAHIFDCFVTREWDWLKGLEGLVGVALFEEVCWRWALRF